MITLKKYLEKRFIKYEYKFKNTGWYVNVSITNNPNYANPQGARIQNRSGE